MLLWDPPRTREHGLVLPLPLFQQAPLRVGCLTCTGGTGASPPHPGRAWLLEPVPLFAGARWC